jgi:hypothetical protein
MRNTKRNVLSGILASTIAGTTGLWSSTAVGADTSGSRPGDANMSCAQIAAELQPYIAQMMPSMTAFGQSAQEMLGRADQRMAERAPVAAGLSAAALAASQDPTGISQKAVSHAAMAYQEQTWRHDVAEDKPLSDQAMQQANQLVAQATPMQSNARLQQLMQLVQQKNCH